MPQLAILGQDLKRIDYDYDLISGKVNEVKYQDGQPDAFYHKYIYDADNRITNVFTKSHNVTLDGDEGWDQDAKYFYYAHGPLARTEIGDKKVQGIDYAYTIQGWQKNVNSETLDPSRDLGKDGNIVTNNLDKLIGQDAFGYTLGYYSGDYVPKAGSTANAVASIASSDVLGARFDLFNGNISYMNTTITDLTHSTYPNAMAYKYDQLNRIKEARGYTNLNSSTNSWQNGSTYAGRYYNGYSYDFNGNILSALAKNSSGTIIDNQAYNYQTVSGDQVNNKLYAITDAASSTGGYDLLTHATFNNTAGTINTANNYGYTEIGELQRDDSAEITDIKRRMDGKIKEIVRATGTKKNLKFEYDAMGNRIAKHVYSNSNTWEHSEYYVVDAQGNLLSTYLLTVDPDPSFKQTEKYIYGSSLIGIDAEQKEQLSASTSITAFSRTLGNKEYTGANHLGNDLVVFTDRKIPIATGTTVSLYLANIVSARDYGCFGEFLTNRVFTPDAFPNSFNGKRDDDELTGWQNYGKRNYLKYSRRLMDRVDPITKKYPELSPYQYASNRPIDGIDQDGLEVITAEVQATEKSKGNTIFKVTSVDYDNTLYTTIANSDQVILHWKDHGYIAVKTIDDIQGITPENFDGIVKENKDYYDKTFLAQQLLNQHAETKLLQAQYHLSNAIMSEPVKRYAFGVEQNAVRLSEQIDASHLMNFKGNWKSEFTRLAARTDTEFHFDLTDLTQNEKLTFKDFSNILAAPKSNTQWELSELYNNFNSKFKQTVFHLGGKEYKGAAVFDALE